MTKILLDDMDRKKNLPSRFRGQIGHDFHDFWWSFFSKVRVDLKSCLSIIVETSIIQYSGTYIFVQNKSFFFHATVFYRYSQNGLIAPILLEPTALDQRSQFNKFRLSECPIDQLHTTTNCARPARSKKNSYCDWKLLKI